MKKSLVAAFGLLGLASGLLFTQTTANLTVNASVSSRFKLELSSNNVTFTRVANPMGEPVIPQNEVPIQVTVKATTSRFLIWPQSYNLRIQAVGQLIDSSTGATIPVEAVSWTASGSGFVSSGTLAADSEILLGTWSTSGNSQGTISFSFKDNPNYAPGVYRLTVTFSLGTS
jgi:hypothetical protein